LISAINVLGDGIATLSVFIRIGGIPAPAPVPPPPPAPPPSLQVHFTRPPPYNFGRTVNLTVFAQDQTGNQVPAQVVVHTGDATAKMLYVVFPANQPHTITLRCFTTTIQVPAPPPPHPSPRPGPIPMIPKTVSVPPDGTLWDPAGHYGPTGFGFGFTEAECLR